MTVEIAPLHLLLDPPVHEHHHDDPTQLRPVPAGTTEETFRVRGMDCSEEIAAIERALKPIAGVLGIRANLLASSVTVYHDGSTQAATLIEAINKSGVTVQKAGSPVHKSQVLPSLSSMLRPKARLKDVFVPCWLRFQSIGKLILNAWPNTFFNGK